MANFKQPQPLQRGLRCSAERHLWRHGGAVLAVYSKINSLTHGGESLYFTSAQKMAEFLGCSIRQTRHAFQVLDETGWLPIVSKPAKNLGQLRAQTHAGKQRRLVSHAEWITKNPDQCFEREGMPWDGEEHDQLGAQLYRLSSGKLKWYANELKALRQSGTSDQEILTVWRGMVEARRAESEAERANGGFGSMKWTALKFEFIKKLANFQPVAA